MDLALALLTLAALGAAALAGYALGWTRGFNAAKNIWEAKT